MSTPISPGAPWQSGTNENSLPANDNVLRHAILDGLVISESTDAQPGSPSDYDIYIMTGSATGAQWSTFDEFDLAIYAEGTWIAYAPSLGIRVNVAGTLKQWNGSAYVDAASGGSASAPTVTTVSSSSGTLTIDLQGGTRKFFKTTLTENVSTLAFSNLPAAGFAAEYELHITQDGTGSRTFAIPASHKALGGSDTAIASAAAAVTVLSAATVDQGTTWRYAMQESA
ncbi:DUF2793 domain-containing protein [Marilutibacter spongiae]|uniref:DUF2793 domain-containing protein n=1 Tax=Marilutibacter spongiae TaxID=2025720 RepID=A0A7W3Y5Z1_9GAMM|nr:DUF2793 domain-containing protein [Lysobacter spongiae]MBB1060436.1 DUF2793 domain-containing protein [Lysobacter spongiae]